MICEMCNFESGHLATVDGDEMYCCDNCGAVMFVYDDRYYADDTIPDSMYEYDGRWYPRIPDTDPAARPPESETT